MNKSVFITGTDTDVGKTQISVALIQLFQKQGLTVAGMKPIASGCDMTATGLRNDDALQLNKQAQINMPYKVINPYHFSPAIAPHIAAEQAGVEIDLKVIQQHFNTLQQQFDCVVVEGAGGWLVPINSHQTMADLAIQLDLPIVLVVDIRLGCINHALLSVAAIEQSGLVLHAWVANQINPTSQADAIIDSLKIRISAPCWAVIPSLKTEQNAVDYFDYPG